MSSNLVIKILKSADTFLQRWNGGDVKISEITWSGLSIRLEKQGCCGYFEICCIGDIEIYGLIKIIDANLNIMHNDKSYIISDRSKNFKIICHHIELKEYLN